MHSLALSEWIGAVGYLGGGLAFSIIYVKEKENIYYPLLVHMLSNSLSLICGMTRWFELVTVIKFLQTTILAPFSDQGIKIVVELCI
ncbi:caax amino protease family protein [Streptococcus pneumoniae]|nr:caax amino protease family protein [Streptococcus pneumoniae]